MNNRLTPTKAVERNIRGEVHLIPDYKGHSEWTSISWKNPKKSVELRWHFDKIAKPDPFIRRRNHRRNRNVFFPRGAQRTAALRRQVHWSGYRALPLLDLTVAKGWSCHANPFNRWPRVYILYSQKYVCLYIDIYQEIYPHISTCTVHM